MIKFTSDIAFLGCSIIEEKTKKSYFVYKINAKTFYAGEMSYDQFISRFKVSQKGTTFKEFAAGVKAKSFSYEGFSISEAEVERGKKVGIKKEPKKEKKMLSTRGESAIRDAYILRYKKGKGCKYPMYDGTMEFHIVAAHPENKVLLNVEGQYVLYGLESKKFFVVEDVCSGKLTMATIPWGNVA